MPQVMPAQKPGKSKQDYCTPRAFVDAVEHLIGERFCWDLAATTEQSLCGDCYFGPDHMNPEFRDALILPWHELRSPLWLNPPFGAIPKWSSKCAEESTGGAKIAFLVPASVGANWYWDHVARYAHVLSVGRISFVNRLPSGSETPACFDAKGKPTPYPKDMILALYGFGKKGVFERWRPGQ